MEGAQRGLLLLDPHRPNHHSALHRLRRPPLRPAEASLAGEPAPAALLRRLGKRLNALREKYAGIQQSSLDFLRELLELARDTVAAEKAVNETPREEQGKAALTELFESLKTDETPVIVENVVNRIDEVVKAVRFEGWQATIRGDQEVRKALRYTLYVQFKIRDNDVFEKALGYVREYY